MLCRLVLGSDFRDREVLVRVLMALIPILYPREQKKAGEERVVPLSLKPDVVLRCNWSQKSKLFFPRLLFLLLAIVFRCRRRRAQSKISLFDTFELISDPAATITSCPQCNLNLQVTNVGRQYLHDSSCRSCVVGELIDPYQMGAQYTSGFR